jgi:hypothetical protein
MREYTWSTTTKTILSWWVIHFAARTCHDTAVAARHGMKAIRTATDFECRTLGAGR